MEKKKLFISCPMKGRTEENIKKSMDKMHKLAEIIFDQELEVIDTYIEVMPPNTNLDIWCLGESLKKMAEADYFIGINCGRDWAGCELEGNVAHQYDITRTYIDIDQVISEEEYKVLMAALHSNRVIRRPYR